MEAVLGTALDHWEHSCEVESNVSVLFTTAKFSVADLKHMINLLLAVTSWRSLLHSLLELVELVDNVLLEWNGLHVHRGLLKWESWKCLSSSSLSSHLVIKEISTLDGLAPESNNSDSLGSMFGLLVLHGLLLEHELDALGLEGAVSDIDSVSFSLGLNLSEDSVGARGLSVDLKKFGFAGSSELSNVPILGESSLPSEGNPTDLFSLSDLLGFGSLHLDHKSLVSNAVKSASVDFLILLSGDLSQDDWSTSVLASEVDLVVFGTSIRVSSFNNSTVLQGVDTLFDDHVRDSLGVVVLFLVRILLNSELE